MGEVNRNLWAPWRMEYIHILNDQNAGRADTDCFLCRYAVDPQADAENLVIWRSQRSLTLFNRFPYANGHLLVAPLGHVGTLFDLAEDVLDEVMHQVRDAQRLLYGVTGCQGCNVGINFGRCAGAGVPGHLHVHLVPRWEGDINFMPVLADTRVIPEAIEALRVRMRTAVGDLGLPAVR